MTAPLDRAPGTLHVDGPSPLTGEVVVRAAGDIDTTSAPALAACLLDLAERPDVRALELDMTSVTFLDSAGLTALAAGHQAAEQAGLALRMRCGSSRAVLRPLAITGLATVFTIVDGGAAAS